MVSIYGKENWRWKKDELKRDEGNWRKEISEKRRKEEYELDDWRKKGMGYVKKEWMGSEDMSFSGWGRKYY